MPSAWCAVGLGHFWILLSYARSPLRTWTQRVSKLDDPAWNSLRHSWGRCLLAGTQGAVILGLMDYSANTFMVAPLLAGAATIFIHQGIILLSRESANSLTPIAGRKSLSRGVIYIVVGALELEIGRAH